MKIQIDKDFQIVSDDSQYILQEIKIAKEGKNAGKEYYTNQKYFGKLESALKCYKEIKIRRSDCTTLNQVIELIKELNTKIDNLLEQ